MVNLCRQLLRSLSVILSTSTMAWAALPLTVQDFTLERGQTKFDLSLSYANIEQAGVSVGETIEFQTGPNSFVSVPTRIGQSALNIDSIASTISLRYAQSPTTELYIRGTHLRTEARTTAEGLQQSSLDSGPADLWLGISRRLAEDNQSPAIIAFVETAIAERTGDRTGTFTSVTGGGTVYRALDPVVLIATVGLKASRSYGREGDKYRRGTLFFANPSISFAVNDRVTLSTGYQWTNRKPDKTQGRLIGQRRTATDLLVGAGFSVSTKNTLNASLKVNASGRTGADLRLTWSRQL
jgi:hypothetical protein